MKIKNLLKEIANGFYSIGEGFASLSLYPKINYKILSDKEAFERDMEKLRGDWRAVGGYLEKAINKLEEEIK